MTREQNQLDRKYQNWIKRCEGIAISQSEWCIDPDMPQWAQWFAVGLTPEQAVNALGDILRERYQ